MNKTPDPEAFKKMAVRLRENSRQWDAFNLQLDELIAKVEADIRRSPLTQYRLKKTKQLSESIKQQTSK